ncbi:MAG: hypothetical protein D4R76_07750 [Methylococcus sp.]|nr:MAG: hypothetical protein D4R76_07750 [Methylococcus sp.]
MVMKLQGCHGVDDGVRPFRKVPAVGERQRALASIESVHSTGGQTDIIRSHRVWMPVCVLSATIGRMGGLLWGGCKAHYGGPEVFFGGLKNENKSIITKAYFENKIILQSHDFLLC